MGDTGIGALLIRLRTARGWTQQRVADEYNALEGRAAKTGKKIGRYERGARIPVPYTRKHLAQAFGVDVAVLDRAVAVSKSLRGEDDRAPEPPQERPARPVVPSCSGVGAVWADAVVSADFARFIAQRNADELVVVQLEADVARLARAYVSHPLLELYVEIKRLRDGRSSYCADASILGRPLTCMSRPAGCADCPRTSAWTWATTTLRPRMPVSPVRAPRRPGTKACWPGCRQWSP
ncbi:MULTISPECIES: helix-turn-helix domain-containing protein [unclassified Streptomyces]|uniref:helix-turn-helix domain-containing protein n=1 Tax=unclassified Streptomyces TaxID=2593676 RepID=UPI002036404F|nr:MULTISPECIES: helix-turn-helix transcriptional regulator [unclassified Streptomyces]